MKITYRMLETMISQMTDEQKDSDLTVECPDGEFYSAELRFANEDNDCLDLDHPFIFAQASLDPEVQS